ncbi:MAG: hypothetical protein NWS60_03970 [Ilumatobacteraceae bacterium]|nr:hypothetical protein [Ilumatobacteraceae bacterium]
MRRLGAVFVVMFTVLLVATGVGASASTSGVGAKVMAGDGQARRAKVLIIGDSVFDAFDHVESARDLLDSQQKTVFAVQGCQKLVDPGCFAWVKLSALDQLKKNAGRFSDVVVIGTGYNDRIGTPFRQAVLAITQEAANQGVDVVWITYRQVRHVRGKATTMNKQLGKLDPKIENLHIADWNAYSAGKEKSGWFRADRIHLVTPGAVGLAQLINQSVAEVAAKRELAVVSG